MLTKTKLYWNTIKYLTWKQIFWRVFLQIKKHINFRLSFLIEPFARRRAENVEIRSHKRLLDRIKGTSWEQVIFSFPIEKAQELVEYNFTYLNRKVCFEEEIQWHDENLSLLWRYHLQYFEHAILLGRAFQVSGNKKYYDTFKEIFLSWVKQNPWGKGIGWHPYNISLRTVNLMYAFDLFKEQLDKDVQFSNVFCYSIAVQLFFLEKHMEFDVGGNHLLENIRALTAGGLFFYGEDAKRWIEKSNMLWEEEVKKQILPDGGHYERSPSYHCRVMKNIGEGYFWLKGENEKLSQMLKGYLSQMYQFLEGMMHPDENLALFNDSVLLEGFEKDALINAGKKLFPNIQKNINGVNIYFFESSGYFGLKEKGEEGIYLIIDCGPVCPDELPAHAHGDILSFELSKGNKRIVVDSGVCTYEKGTWRNFARSTRAHNTVEVGDKDQCELWGSFRVGKRVKPKFLEWKREGKDYIFRGKHSAYKEAFGIEHERKIIYINNQLLLVMDHLKNDPFRSGVRAKSFLHLHPELEIEKNGFNYFIRGQNDEVYEFLPLAYEGISYEKGVKEEKGAQVQGWYMPKFGKKCSNYVLVLERELKRDCLLGYLLKLSNVKVETNIRKERNSWLIDVSLDEEKYSYTLF